MEYFNNNIDVFKDDVVLNIDKRFFQLRCNEFIVTFPKKYQMQWANHYSFKKGETIHILDQQQGSEQIKPRDLRLRLEKFDEKALQKAGRLYRIKMGSHEMFLSANQDNREPDEALADYILDATKEYVQPKHLMVNGIRGCFHGQFSNEFTYKEWWFKKESTILSIVIRGPGIPLRNTKKDIQWIIEHVS